MPGQSLRDSSFISEQQPNFCLKILRKLDIFSFIPVPKDDSVSTRQSLIGTAIFFTIFVAYIIYDFVTFVTDNPPIIQAYNTPLDQQYYTLPSFALAFMDNNPNYDHTETFQNFMTHSWSTKVKTMGQQNTVPINISQVRYQKQTNNKTNFDLLPWMNQDTKKFYYILRTPSSPLKSRGLLFSTDVAVYPSIKLNFCVQNGNTTCLKGDDKSSLTNYGRLFLFIQQQKDDSSVSKDETNQNGNNYLQYNFFVIEGFYKRITINFQVVRTEVLEDYFWRWSKEKTQYIQIDSISQQMSKVDSLANNPDAIAFNFQLSPNILNNRVSFKTLLDHVSMWGAFWGVLFAIFALFFLSYNRKKFYQKNPEWQNFKKVAQGNRTLAEDQGK